MIGVTLMDKRKADWVRKQMYVKDILVEIKKKWAWTGYEARGQDKSNRLDSNRRQACQGEGDSVVGR